MHFEFYFLAFIISIFLTLLITPIVGSFAIKFKAIDKPSGRKIHRKEVPLLGGCAIFISIFTTVLILKRITPEFNALMNYNSGYILKLFEGILVGSIVITAMGIVDDFKGVIPTTKLLGQIIVAMIVMQYGIKIASIKFPFFGTYTELPIYVSMLVTILWITGFINSINLIDGVDGLAGGVVAIAFLVFFIITLYQTTVQTEPAAIKRLKFVSVLSLIICGSTLGFLKYNFPPAKIFLGDSGSLLLGFLAGVVTITGILKTAAALTLLIPIIVFGVPLLDAFLSFFRRVATRKSFMHADREHIHHRLLYKRGWNAKKVDYTIYTVTSILGAVAILITILK
ncbi:MAG: glycosyltransferase family 4 protein [Elusimicrobiota bacterium]